MCTVFDIFMTFCIFELARLAACQIVKFFSFAWPHMSRLAKRVKSLNERNILVDDPVARALALKNIRQRAITQELSEFTDQYYAAISAIQNTSFPNTTGMLVPISYDVIIPEVKDTLLQSIPLYFADGSRIMSDEEWPQGLQVYALVRPPPRYAYEFWEDEKSPKKTKNYAM